GLLGRAGRQKSQFLAGGIDHQDAGAGQAAGGDVKVSLRVNPHAVAAVLLAEIHQDLSGAIHQPLVVERKGINPHRAALRFGVAWGETIAAVIVIGDVEGPLVRAEGDAVWFLHFARDFDNRPIFSEAIDGFVRQLARLGAAVTRIREVNAALHVHAQVVRRIESLPLVAVGENFTLAGLEVPAPDGSAASIGTVTGEEISIRVNSQSVRFAGVVGKDTGLPGPRIETEDHSVLFAEGHVRKINAAIRSGCGSFGQATVEFYLTGVKQFQFGARRNDRVRSRFGGSGRNAG